jgi:hypothetical protein
VRELPELARFAHRPAFGFGTLPGALELQPLSREALPALLYRATLGRKSGLLVLRSGRREKRVALRAGAPVLVASTAREELLGQRLVARGQLGSNELDACLERCLSRGTRLGSVLVERQLIRPGALLRALGDQVEERFIDVGDYRDGEIGFTTEAVDVHEHVPPLRRPGALVTRLVRARYDDAEIESLLAPAMHAPLAPSPHPSFELSALALDDAEARVVTLASGARSQRALIDKLAAVGRIPPATARRALFVALSAGLLVSPAWPPRRAPLAAAGR